MSYQSPISLTSEHSLRIDPDLTIWGKIKRVKYHSQKQVFEVGSKVILKIDNQKYRLREYHFHTPGEHSLGRKVCSHELHYVFTTESSSQSLDVCGGDVCSEHVLILGHALNASSEDKPISPKKLPLQVPPCYFMYDGGLPGENFSNPVRWMFNRHPLFLNLDSLNYVSKSARPLQPLNGRIILRGHF